MWLVGTAAEDEVAELEDATVGLRRERSLSVLNDMAWWQSSSAVTACCGFVDLRSA